MPGFDLTGSVQAGQGLVSPIASAFHDWENQQKETSYTDAIVQHAYDKGVIGLEDLTKYQRASSKQKVGIATGIAANLHDDMQRQAATDASALAKAHADYYNRDAAATNWVPTQEDRNTAYSLGGDYIRTPRGFAFAPYPTGDNNSTSPIQVDPFIDPTTQKPVPGVGIVRKTGAIEHFGNLLDTGGGVKLEQDPKTGIFFYRDNKGNIKPLKPADVMTSQATMPEQPAAPASPTPTATPAPPVFPQVNEVRKWNGGGYRFKGGDPSDKNNWEQVQ